MAIKASNSVDAIRDRIIRSDPVDLSAGKVQHLFCDTQDDWTVVEAYFIPEVAGYIASQATAVDLGTITDDDKFLEDAAVGSAVIAVGSVKDLSGSLPAAERSRKLAKGEVLRLNSKASASQTGEGRYYVRLRAMDRARGNRTKRPSRTNL